jgi:hypothetical protein
VHDIGRTQAEYWGGGAPGQSGEYGYSGEFGSNGAYEAEAEYGMPGESGEYDITGEQEYYGESEGVFSEADEMELATELLGVASEDELDQFIGDLLRKASSVVGKAISSPVGQALGGMIKNVAKQALPMVGGALGNIVMPGVGGAIGSQLANTAGQMFGLELEGLSQEDQEFEAARRVVRLGAAAVENAATAPPSAPPGPTARAAMETAAQTHAPGLITPPNYGFSEPNQPTRQSGRWYRRGARIVLVGV